jgi:hypothetical protein
MNESVPLWFLENPKLWIHCKNQNAWQELVENKLVNAFIHDSEPWTQTTNKTTWVHSDYSPLKFEKMFKDNKDWWKSYGGPVFTYFVNQRRLWEFGACEFGICSDYIGSYV